LEAALSSNAQQVSDEPLPPGGAIVARIKKLKAVYTLEATPQRSVTRTTAAVEEAITTRIRQREQAAAAAQPDDEPPPVAPPPPAAPPVTTPEPPATPAQ